MMNDYIMISTFYEMGNLTPSLEWYRDCNFITNDQYQQIKGTKDDSNEGQQNNNGQATS